MNAFVTERETFEQKSSLLRVFEFARAWTLKGFDCDAVYFVGCGSSYNMSISASKYFSKVLGVETKAMPAGEVIFAREENVSPGRKLAFLISRTGNTTEVLLAAKELKEMGIRTVGLTIEGGSELVKVCDEHVVLPLEERAIVTTRAFSGMLLFLTILADKLAGTFESEVYASLIDGIDKTLEESVSIVEERRLDSHDYFVFLGMGVYEGIARESLLKVQEMALCKGEAHSTLEYRHGPIALAEPSVAVVVYEKNHEERRLAGELKGYGVTVVERESLDDGERDGFVQVVFSHVLGLKLAKRKGINPDHPRHLSRTVSI